MPASCSYMKRQNASCARFEYGCDEWPTSSVLPTDEYIGDIESALVTIQHSVEPSGASPAGGQAQLPLVDAYLFGTTLWLELSFRRALLAASQLDGLVAMLAGEFGVAPSEVQCKQGGDSEVVMVTIVSTVGGEAASAAQGRLDKIGRAHV